MHDHAAFRVYVNGERLPFTDPAFDLSRTGYVRAHLHVTEPHAGETIHIEDRFPRGEPNVTLNEFLASLGMELDDGRLALSRVHGGETLTDNTTHSVKLAIRRDAGTFAPRPSWGEHVLANCDSVLISYGPRSDNLEPQEASIAMPPGGTSGTTCA